MSQLREGDALGASYRLVERIGAGAAGDVWKAEAVSGGPMLAAKILKAEHAVDPALVERFIRERSVLLGLKHENIVEVRDLVVEGATLAIVMEFLTGGSLRDLLEGARTLPPADALALCAQVFRALAVAHSQGVTHRDIKPDNVLLTEPWQPGQQSAARVTDFGIASVVSERNRQTTGLLGTPFYMAPELLVTGQTAPAADVYSTGIMLYELIAGRTPFAGSGNDFTIAYRHVNASLPKLDLPGPLWTALARLLAKDPRERPSAADAAIELERLATQFRDLPALEPLAQVEEFEELERPATMFRGNLMPDTETIPEYVSPLAADAPELGESGGHTIVRPMPRRESQSVQAKPQAAVSTGATSSWLTKRMLLLGAAGVVLLVALVAGSIMIFGNGKPTAGPEAANTAVQATQQDPPLPTGLTTSRKAEFDPQSGQITLEITYTAQKAALSGSLFEAVPGVGKDAPCPAVTWTGATGTKHQSATTGLQATCGWSLDGVQLQPNGQAQVTGTLTGTVADATALNDWLGNVAATTSGVLTDTQSVSTAYPVQRLQGIAVQVPPRAVSETPLAVTLLPVWPSGPDEINPMFKSPATGAPSQMLQDVVGGPNPVVISDACSGAVSVAPDGVTVTALSVTSNCHLRATVGNFTNLESNPFSITTRE